MSDDYESLLDTGWEELPEVQILPEGEYLLKGRSASYKPGKGSSNPFFMFVYDVKDVEDLDPDGLKELGDYDVSNNKIFHRVWIENGADIKNINAFLAKHGVKSSTPREGLKDFKGSEVVAYLKQRHYTVNGEDREENVIDSVSPLS